MDRLFLGIIIVILSSACGFLLAKKHRKRKAFFTQLYQFNERFLNEIAYYRRPITEFVSQFTYKGEFALLLENYFESVKNGDDVLLLDLQNDSNFSFLIEEEKNEITDYFYTLGKGDSVSQKNYFSSQKERLSKRQTEADTVAKKYVDLYVKLGFLFGLFLLIILI
jgi:stage III sporulation protein AB